MDEKVVERIAVALEQIVVVIEKIDARLENADLGTDFEPVLRQVRADEDAAL